MNLAKLQELKQKLIQDAQLPPVWTFFMDHFADKPEFIALGDRARHPLVEAVVAQVAEQMFPKDGKVRGLMLSRLADQQFLHGGLMMGRRIGGVIYFEDAHIGLIAVADTPPSIEVKYARFSGRPIADRGEPSLN
jgi:hypothetical protein